MRDLPTLALSQVLRRFINGVFFALSILVGSFVCLCTLLVSRRKGPTWVMQTWAKSLVGAAGLKLEIHGAEHVEPDRPCIYMSNHESTIDIPALIAALPVHLRFVYKKSLGMIPFVGWAIWAMGMIPIDRSNRSNAMLSLKKAGDRVKSGFPVLIFPEGTRARGKGLLPFKKGGFILALRAGLDIVPITLVDSQALCPRNSIMVKPGTLKVIIHPRVHIEQYSESKRNELMADVRETMASAMNTGSNKATEASTCA